MSTSTLPGVVPTTRKSAEQQTESRREVDAAPPAPATTTKPLAWTPAAVRYTTRSAPAIQSEPAEPQEPRNAAYEHGGKRASVAERVAAALATFSEFPSLATVESDYPHLIPKIRAAWGSPDRFAQLMSDLLLADRGGRQGFAPQAVVELTRLQDYYERQLAEAEEGSHPVPRWPER